MMSRAYRLGVVFLCIVLINWTCVEEIDLPTDKDYEKSIGVSAKMIYQEDYEQVSIEVSGVEQGISSGSFSEPVNFKKIVIINSKNQEWEIENLGSGLYGGTKTLDDPDFDLNKDLEFKIILDLFSGDIIHSEFESVEATTRVDDVVYELDYNDTGEELQRVKTVVNLEPQNVKSNSRIFPVETYRLTEVAGSNDSLKNICYFRQELFLDEIILVDKNGSGSTLKGLIPYDRKLVDFLKAEGYFLEITTESLTDEAFEYWRQIKLLLERTGSMFDEAPGTLVSNLYNENSGGAKPIGYFYVTSQTTKGHFFSVAEIRKGQKSMSPLCPITNQVGTVNPVCYDCTKLKGATLTPPPFWPEEWTGLDSPLE